MGLSLLGFVLVQGLALLVARGGGAQRLRTALATCRSVTGASDAQLFAALGAPAQLRRATEADDGFAAAPDLVADWIEPGPRGGWHVGLAFAGGHCLGISACNFHPWHDLRGQA